MGKNVDEQMREILEALKKEIEERDDVTESGLADELNISHLNEKPNRRPDRRMLLEDLVKLINHLEMPFIVSQVVLQRHKQYKKRR